MAKISAPERRDRATRAAWITALLVTLLCGLALSTHSAMTTAGSPTSPISTNTTTVSSPETTQTATTTTTGKNPSSSTVVTVSPKTDQTTTVTSSPARDTSLLGNVFANPGSALILEFLIVLVAAFLAGAAVQRIWLGEYAIKMGNLEIDPLPPITEDSARTVRDQIPSARPEQTMAPPPELGFWWNQDPQDDPDEKTEILLRRASMQAGAREVAARIGLQPVADFEDVVDGLALSPAAVDRALARSLLRLDRIGHRVQHGAQLEDGAGPLLLEALAKATRALAAAATAA